MSRATLATIKGAPFRGMPPAYYKFVAEHKNPTHRIEVEDSTHSVYAMNSDEKKIMDIPEDRLWEPWVWILSPARQSYALESNAEYPTDKGTTICFKELYVDSYRRVGVAVLA